MWNRLNLSVMSTTSKQLYTLRDEQSQITNNRDAVIKEEKELYRILYSSNDRQTDDPILKTMNTERPYIRKHLW